ncbi:restriction endonuclease subunit S [Acinetobacter baumannii]|uniref:restriction endonuclease subunit S n=1 Tax=Acinetobacter baumannii TaxID=470 RepID=UPI001A927A95|nr:restriction endonuclease subunit S [Acinetobacter baumannii]MBO0634327.1 restriction endonuclease subunit S [Acinetobacter baumannii]
MAFNSTPEEINEQNINGLLSSCAEWERVELANIVKVVNGFAFKSAEFNSNGEGNRLIRIRDILKGDTQTYFTGKVPDGYWVNSDDIIIGMDGDFNIAWWTGKPALLNQRVCKLDNLTKFFDKHLLFRLMPGYLDAINANTSSTTVKHLSSKTLEGLLLPLPSLAEQKVISNKLETLLAEVENIKVRLERIPEILKKFRQSVLAAAVSGKLTKAWRLKNPTQSVKLHVEKHNENKKGLLKVRGRKGWGPEINLFDLPANWAWIENYKLAIDERNAICAGPFGTIFKAKDFRDEGIPIIFLRHVKESGFNQNNPTFMDEEVWKEWHQDYSVFGGELLVTKLGDPPGECCIFPEGIGVGMVTPDVLKMNVDTKVVNKQYLKHFFNSPVSKKMVADAAFGATRLRIDISLFKLFPIPLPPINEQTEIARQVDELFDFADRIERKTNDALKSIDNLTHSILAKAFRGELTAEWRAANLELISGDNSPKALLEKIKAERKLIKKLPKPKKLAVKEKNGACMTKQIIKVTEALKQAGKPLSGQQLLVAAGYPSDSSTNQLEQFFLDIRNALTIEKSIIKLERRDDSQDWFTLYNPLENK